MRNPIMGFTHEILIVFFSLTSIWSKVARDEAQQERGWSGVKEITLNRLMGGLGAILVAQWVELKEKPSVAYCLS